ncbi:MAG: hypothetical protein JRH01_20745, partial [Deltaproteobacteria bacterium]|nr:hypothetical protein [Deltaproteobacteria bacterium]
MLARYATIALLSVLLVPTAPASAAQISQISWDVTGGFFNAGFPGAVTGGTLVWTPVAGTVDTGVSGTHIGFFNLLATGLSTSLFHLSIPNASGYVFLAPGSSVSAFFSFGGQAYSGNGAAFPGSGAPTIVPLVRSGFIGGGSGSFVNIALAGGGPASWNIILGNEVKTVVPEPATGSM